MDLNWLLFLICSRSVSLDSVQTSMETGTTTGRRTIWPELSGTQESMMEIMSIMSPCCWQTSTKSECLKADDNEPICAVGWPPNEPQLCDIYFPVASYHYVCHSFQRYFLMNSSGLSSFMFFFYFSYRQSSKDLYKTMCPFMVPCHNRTSSEQKRHLSQSLKLKFVW